MPVNKDEAPSGNGKPLVKYWLNEIEDSLKRESKYRKLGNEIVEIYEARKPDDVPFNILYSNTETLAPAVYNARPIPIVSRRYKDPDPMGKAVAEVSTRLLKFLIDTDSKSYDNYDELTQASVLDSLITNRGLSRWRYMAREGDIPECAYGESVRWDKFFHGYARTWKKVPWVGFEWDMSKDDLKKNFKDSPIDYKKVGDSDEQDTAGESQDELAGVKTFKVYEIWDKKSGKVMFFSRLCPDEALRVVDDPLGLSTFFPTARPLNFMKKVTTLVPTPLYQQYRQQVQELNDITKRLKAIIRAIKFRGAYNSTVEGMEKMLAADDNELVPVENIQAMGDNTGMDKLIWVVPVNELVQTAQSLYQQRESCKQVIYEITGISDILRGASVASETATAQNIKNQWGTLRLKKMQKEVQRYVRETLELLLEIAAAKFEIETIRKMTGLPYLSNAEKQQIQQQMKMMQGQYQAIASQAQAAGQQPPPPPPEPPAEVMDALQQPSWEDIMQVMRSDMLLHYKVDIETNSTIDAEAAQDKQDIAELMNAISQFLNGVAPLVQQGALPIDVAKTMLLVVARRFNFGSQLEDAINKMAAPKPQADPAAEQKAQQAQVEAQAAAQQAQAQMQQSQMDMKLAQQEFEQKQATLQAEGQLKQMELEIKRAELELQKEGLGAKLEFQRQSNQLKLEALRAKPKETSDASV